MAQPQHDISMVRDAVEAKYLTFRHGALHFEIRDPIAEMAEHRQLLSEALGHELQLPEWPAGSIQLWIVDDDSDEVVGEAARELVSVDARLVAVHKQLRIRRPALRRRGFGSALLAACEDWYREADVDSIVMSAEGDGSVFAALRGFDFHLETYAKRGKLIGLEGMQLRYGAVVNLIGHPGVHDTVEDDQAPTRESAKRLLARLEALGEEPARQVLEFRARLPEKNVCGDRLRFSGSENTFASPAEIADFGIREPLDALSGETLGRAVLARTSWAGVKWLS